MTTKDKNAQQNLRTGHIAKGHIFLCGRI